MSDTSFRRNVIRITKLSKQKSTIKKHGIGEDKKKVSFEAAPLLTRKCCTWYHSRFRVTNIRYYLIYLNFFTWPNTVMTFYEIVVNSKRLPVNLRLIESGSYCTEL